jgi:hypothetical protein
MLKTADYFERVMEVSQFVADCAVPIAPTTKVAARINAMASFMAFIFRIMLSEYENGAKVPAIF